MNGLSLRVSGKTHRDNFKLEKQAPVFIPTSKTYWQFFNSHKYDEFHSATSVSQQMEFLKIISKDEENLPKELKFLLAIFFEAPLKHNLKNFVSKLLVTKKQYYDIIPEIGAKYLKQLISETNQSSFTVRNDVCNSINSCFDNFYPGIIIINECLMESIQFLSSILNSLLKIVKNNIENLPPTEKLFYYDLIHNLIRTFVNIFQKCSVLNLKRDSLLEELLFNSLYLFTCSEIQMDTKSNSAMVFVLIKKLFKEEQYLFKIMRNGNKLDENVINSNKTELSNDSKICLFSAVINIIDENELLVQEVHGETALNFISNSVLKMSEELSVETTIILAISRMMLSLSRLISKIDVPEYTVAVANTILQFVWSHLEYYINSVKHLAVQILTNIIKISMKFEKNGNNTLSENIFQSINALSCENEAKYRGFSILVSEFGCELVLKKNNNLIEEMILVLQKINNTSSVISAFNNMISKHEKEVNVEILFNTWVMPICKVIQNISVGDENKTDPYEEILTNMVKINPYLVDYILKYVTSDKNISQIHCDEDYKLLLITLYAARKTKYFDSKQTEGDMWKNLIPIEILQTIVVHHDFDLCMLCLSIIVESHKTTEYFTKQDFAIVLKYLYYNINVQSPAARQKMLSCLKKMINRWKSSFDIVTKKNNIILKEIYIDFISTLWKFSMNNFFYGANYSRRNVSLNLLQWCLRLDVEFSSEKYWKPEDILQIKEYIDDSYECNKILAVQILSACPFSALENSYFKNINELFKSTLQMASSVKPTDCSTSAYVFELLLNFPQLSPLFESEIKFITNENMPYLNHLGLINILISHLKSELEIGEINILFAAAHGPIYGLLFCIKHILKLIDLKKLSSNEDWRLCINEIIELLIKASSIVGPIVNNDSPEGYLPMDFGEVTTKNSMSMDISNVTSQMVLVCAWRSIKEISLILGDLSYRGISNDNNVVELLDEKQLLRIGDHFITLLSETKHRGAFEQAYIGFAQLCSRLWVCKSETLCKLPSIWLKDLIESISSGDLNNSKLCATRRSAGVPFIVQALVTTELQVTGSMQNFQECMCTLLKLTSFNNQNKEVSVETRTHCLNILRALFKHTALGDFVNIYVADGLMTAINGFDGKTWAERNSSTLLYSSLITRIFGVQRTKDSDDLCIRNRMTGRIFFLRYPKLYDFIMNHLKSCENDVTKNFLRPSLYPVLLLLSRLYPSALEGTESNLQLVNFIPYLLKCSESPVLKTRQLAAKAIVPLISPDRVISYLKKLMNILCDENIKINFSHGILLQISRLLKVIPNNSLIEMKDSTDFIDLFHKSLWILKNIESNKPCLIIADVYVSNLLLFLKKYPKIFHQEFTLFSNISQLELLSLNDTKNNFRLHFNKEQYNCAMLHFKIFIYAFSNDIMNLVNILIKCLMHDMYEIVQTTLKYIFCLYKSEDKSTYSDKFEINNCQTDLASMLTDDEKDTIVRHIENSDCEYFNLLINITESSKYLPNKDIALYLMSMTSTLDCYRLTDHKDLEQQIAALITLCENENALFKSHYLKLIDKALQINKEKSLQFLLNENTIEMLLVFLYNCSSPESNYEVRLEVANIFVNNFQSFEWTLDLDSINKNDKLIIQLITIFQLLDDEEISIRQKISRIASSFLNLYSDSGLKSSNMKLISPNLVKELIIQKISQPSESRDFIMLISFWILLALADGSFNFDKDSELDSQVFEKGEVNTFREDLILCRLCSAQIGKIIKTNKGQNTKPFLILENIIKCQIFPYFSKHQSLVSCISNFLSISELICQNKDSYSYSEIDVFIVENASNSITILESKKIKTIILSILNAYNF